MDNITNFEEGIPKSIKDILSNEEAIIKISDKFIEKHHKELLKTIRYKSLPIDNMKVNVLDKIRIDGKDKKIEPSD